MTIIINESPIQQSGKQDTKRPEGSNSGEILKLAGLPKYANGQYLLEKIRTEDPEGITKLYLAAKDRELITPPYPGLGIQADPKTLVAFMTGDKQAGAILAPGISQRRKNRHEQYVNYLITVLSRLLQEQKIKLPKDAKIVDIGCGDGEITRKIWFREGCDQPEGCDVVDYRSQRAREQIRFVLKSALNFLQETPDNSYDVVTENVMLHHLSSLKDYIDAVENMVRITKRGGMIMITETIHQNNDLVGLFRNAIYDILLNDITSITHAGKRVIPVPVQFLSEELMDLLLKNLGIKILFKGEMEQTEWDPKRHIVWVGTKEK